MKKLIALAAVVCTFVATTLSASACFWGYYQPEEPKGLREE